MQFGDAFQPMTFVDESIKLLSKNRQGAIWPCGSSRTIMVDNAPVHRGEPFVQFEDHRYETRDAYTAQGLIRAGAFLDKDGFSLDVSCLPDVLLPYWGTSSSYIRKEICLALAKGTTPDEIAKKLGAPIAPPPEIDSSKIDTGLCPVPGCGVKVEGAKNAAQAKIALFEHVRLVHPDWQK